MTLPFGVSMMAVALMVKTTIDDMRPKIVHNLSHFTCVFKDRFGLSSGEYRKAFHPVGHQSPAQQNEKSGAPRR